MNDPVIVESAISKTSFLLFRLLWVVLSVAILAIVIFQAHSGLGLIGDVYNGLRELIFFGGAITLLLLVPEPKISIFLRMLPVFGVLIGAIFLSATLGYYVDLASLNIIGVAFVSFVILIFGRSIFTLLETKFLPNWFIVVCSVVTFVVVIVSGYMSIKIFSRGTQAVDNYTYLSQLQCKSAYGISASEFKSYCDKFVVVDNQWLQYKNRCEEVYAKLLNNSEYSDSADESANNKVPFIGPELYNQCNANFNIFKYTFIRPASGPSVYDTYNLTRPEFKDPLVCEKSGERKECYMRVINKTGDYTLCDKFPEPDRSFCYKKGAEANGDRAMCERVANDKGSRDSCYSKVASKLKDPAVCELISGKFLYIKDQCLAGAKVPQ